jgi:hypothetical protein
MKSDKGLNNRGRRREKENDAATQETREVDSHRIGSIDKGKHNAKARKAQAQIRNLP